MFRFSFRVNKCNVLYNCYLKPPKVTVGLRALHNLRLILSIVIRTRSAQPQKVNISHQLTVQFSQRWEFWFIHPLKWVSFLFRTPSEDILENVNNQTTLNPIDFHYLNTKHIDISPNIFCCVPPKKSHVQIHNHTRENKWWLNEVRSWSFFLYLSGIHHCAHSHSQSHGGHFWKIVSKETGVGHYSVFGQGLHSGSGHQTGSGLIKGDVPIRSDPWKQ